MSSKFSHFSYEGDEGVYGRRLRLCPSLQSCETPDLIRSCPDCSQFLLVCCSCRKRFPKITKPCHHFSLLFTDGACRNNGQVGATAGIGFAHGTNEQSWIALPITDEMDSFPKRTSQRAELLAALKGLQYICEVIIPCSHGPGASDGAFIIATDSEYVVKGMTEWLPQWKVSISIPEINLMKLISFAGAQLAQC